MSTPGDELLTTDQVAALLGIKRNTLEVHRVTGKSPIPFIKLGTAKQAPVRYRRSEVETWMQERTFVSTSAYCAKAGAL